MVAAAGAGAASSSMKITGTMDTSNIDRGFARVGQGFQGIKGNAKSFGADMKRVSITVAGLAKKMITLGIAGVAALVGIASKAPAVAPAMAKISVSFGKIQRSLGEALAPAFEKVAGWLDKLAVWIDNNKEKIGDLAIKFLDWGSALAEKVWPWLEKIGNWAVEHPGLFTGILAGLALAPTVIAGISSVAGLVTLLTGATVSASLLTTLGYLALLGAGAFAVFKLLDKTGDFLVQEAEQVPGTLQSLRSVDTSASEIAAAGYQPTPDGRIDVGDERRGWFLQWWSAVRG